MGAGISYGEAVANFNELATGKENILGAFNTNTESQRKEVDSFSEQGTSASSSDERQFPAGASEFQKTIAAAAQQLHLRQKSGDVSVSKAEMDDLIILSRELENFLSNLKESNHGSVQESWKELEDSGRLDEFGDKLYADVLQSNPYLRVFFFGVELKEQPRTLLRMLGTAVYALDKPHLIGDLFVKSGARHRGFGVTTETFQSFRTSFFKVFPGFIGEEKFKEIEEQWKEFWRYIIEKLDQGNSSREGERYAQMYEQKNLETLQNDWALLTERQNKCDPRHQFVGIMYAKAMEMYGDLSKFDALRDLRSATRVFQSYVEIVSILSDKETADEYLLELGARHVAYNVTVENLISFTEPFLYACRHFLEKEWNVAMESRFLNAFRYMVDGITTGMVNGMNTMENKRAPQTSEEFCLIFTDIEGSTNLWQKDSHAMGHAVKQHHRLIRSLIAEYGAYEVKTVGDSFIIAAKDVLLGMKLSIAIQLELMRMAPIAPNFEMLETTEGYGDPTKWDQEDTTGPDRLEHCREASATYDTIHRRYDYYGPSVNRCSRIESAACGGQILLSEDSYNVLKSIPEFVNEKCEGFFRSLEIPSPSKKLDDSGLDKFIDVEDIGFVKLKGNWKTSAPILRGSYCS